MNLVRGNHVRRPVARQQPPMKDKRTKRVRDRSAQKRAAIRDAGG